MIKWLGDVAVDTATGEVLDYQLPPCINDDVSAIAKGVVDELFLNGVYTNAEINKETRGRKPKAIDNPFMSYFAGLHWNEGFGKYDMPYLLDDVIYGACNSHTNNTRIPVNQLIIVMAHLSLLSTQSIQEMLSKRRVIKEEGVLGERYCRSILAACESLIKSMGYYLEIGRLNLSGNTTFIFEIDAKAYHKYRYSPTCSIASRPFTEGEKEYIRRLSTIGMVSRIKNYVHEVNIHTQRWLSKTSDVFRKN
ncbi:hypothetical protein [Serratia odorifera]|uniref:Uncharacterized protein n=2 Tax=Serratia odorifera TaxID=618 RepID=D4E3V2_SEROD|nr:hypothetical protein [Serratia odorifera]EFE95650.1 hypothetical protein HMPREF0758_2852 [Serratia odorifera DSM 4582]PNK90202.1 hypothetical protein CEQ31_011070 [Serratia odorifera]RII71357.1 hypothetical protein DX901_15255 [Serratia odorifera]VDZ60541.1 Uncharacterised protein [Serratia odorifera]